MKYAIASKEVVLPDGLGLNRCSNNRSKPPPPIPDRAFRCVSRVGLGIFYFSISNSSPRDAIRCNSMGRQIRSSAEAKLRIMRAPQTHISCFSSAPAKPDSEEFGEEARPRRISREFFSLSFPAKKRQQRSVKGTHAFPLLASVPRQRKEFETRIFGSSRTRRIDVICKIEI